MSFISYLHVFQLRLLSTLFSSFSFVISFISYVMVIPLSLTLQVATTLLPTSRDISAARALQSSLSSASPQHKPLSLQERSERLDDEKGSPDERKKRFSKRFGQGEDDKDTRRGAFCRPLSMRYHSTSPSLVRSPSPRPTDSKVIKDRKLFESIEKLTLLSSAGHARPTQHTDQVAFLSGRFVFAGTIRRSTRFRIRYRTGSRYVDVD
jgi:hypothetical protein